METSTLREIQTKKGILFLSFKIIKQMDFFILRATDGACEFSDEDNDMVGDFYC